ncbi:metallophosphoesterase family protein [Sphingobacterium sp. xlx-130]|uniref:metallophosphoesterase family protein n=1 Tax=Sphingobacterium sp. xlx-130 TaxID=2654323 RepID=UPI0013DB63AE|nr:metallophosphoesterase family protein [Sphingobacterium sp. xlx-130]
MRKIIVIIFTFAFGLSLKVDGNNYIYECILSSDSVDYIVPPILKFNKDRKFKVVQFTDFHYQYNSRRSDTAVMQALEVIRLEKPDLVVLSGDVVCSQNTSLAWKCLADSMKSSTTPWAVILGNHDIEYEMTGREIMDQLTGLPYCMAVNGPSDISGHGNYVLSILDSEGKQRVNELYFMDTHTSLRKDKSLGEYDWIKSDQILWFKHQAVLSEQELGKIVPSLLFIHIPLPEYNNVLYQNSTIGIQEELICSPDMNSGMFTALKESGDVMGVFCGHDHNNNFIGEYRDIALAYGSVSGIECYGKIGRGARVIELNEDKRGFTTWIRYPAAPVKYKVSYPDFYKKIK